MKRRIHWWKKSSHEDKSIDEEDSDVDDDVEQRGLEVLRNLYCTVKGARLRTWFNATKCKDALESHRKRRITKMVLSVQIHPESEISELVRNQNMT
jgi:hypothetical protein